MLLSAALAMYLLLFSPVFLPVAMAEEPEEEVYLTALAIDVEPMSGWFIERWSDWDFDAVDKAETSKVHFFSTAFQVPVDENAARVWGELAVEQLEALGHSGGTVAAASVGTFDGRAVGETTVEFDYQGKHAAVLYLRSFPVLGNTAHLATFSTKRRAAKAKKALDVWSGALTFDKLPAELPTTSTVDATEMAYGTTLPAGYRAPLKSELSIARNLAAETGQSYGSDGCWLGVSPRPDGDASVLVSCQAGMWLGVFDSYSFAAVEADLHENYFSGIEVPTGIGYEHADRLSVIWHPPSQGDKALRMALTPYDRGVALTYAMGPSSDVAALDLAIRGALDGMTFTGEGGGAHPTGAAAWIMYAAKFRPAYLVGGVVPFILLFGMIALKVRNAKPSWEDEI